MAKDGSIHKMGSDGSNIVTGKYQIDGHLYSDDGGYDQLHRRFLTGIDTGNLYSSYYRTADGKDNWKELPYDRLKNKFDHISLVNPLGEQTQLEDVTYGEEAVINGADIVYSPERKVFVDTQMEAPIPLSFVNEHRDRIIPSSLQPTEIQAGDDGFTATPIEPPTPQKPDNSDIALIGSGIALSQQAQRQVPVPDNTFTQYSADVLKESVLSTADDTVLKTMGKDLKPFGTIDDFYTVQEDMHKYQFPYNGLIAGADLMVPNAASVISTYFSLRSGCRYSPEMAAILSKVAASNVMEIIKERYLKKTEK